MLIANRLAPRIAFTAALATAALVGAGFAVANASGKTDSPQRANRSAVTAPAPAGENAAPIQEATAPTGEAPEVKAPAAAPQSLRKVDWKNVTLKLPRLRPGSTCGGGTIKFVNGYAGKGEGRYQILPGKRKAAYGNLAGDRHEEAAVVVWCGSESADHLVVVKGTRAKPTVLGLVNSEHWGVAFPSYRITAKKTLEVTAKETLEEYPCTQLRTFAWSGSAFKQVSGPRQFPAPVDGHNYDWSTATLTIPFKDASTTVQPNDRSCPRVTVKFTHVHDGVGAVQAGGCEYWIHKVGTANLDGDSTADSLVKISALRMGTGDMTTGAEWYFAYGFRNHKPVLLGHVTAAGLDNRDDNAAPDVSTISVAADFHKVYVTQIFRTPGKPNLTLTRTFTWKTNRFLPNVAAPSPRTDLAP